MSSRFSGRETGKLRADWIHARDLCRARIGEVDIEVQRHGQAVIQLGAAEGAVVAQAVVQGREHLLALFGGEGQAEQGFGGGDMFACELEF